MGAGREETTLVILQIPIYGRKARIETAVLASQPSRLPPGPPSGARLSSVFSRSRTLAS